MLDLYVWTTLNGYKVAILLEEPYQDGDLCPSICANATKSFSGSCSKWLTSAQCSDKPIISVVMRRSRSPTQSNFTPEKQRDSIVCSTSDWAKLNFSLATTPLLIWRSIPGCVPINGKDKTSPHGRTCNAGTTQCALVLRFSEA